MEIAVKKIAEKDYQGAKKSLSKAKIFDPKLKGLKQVFVMINVYISASNKKRRRIRLVWNPRCRSFRERRQNEETLQEISFFASSGLEQV
ncbi:unnamed protein product [Arabis nemorensis]|uniref:Uncharacterized protein n=1 Tax=Arabis nemorensis TaxID=586526 RepID=A0A565CWT9_9BRAS|nr:unnamed protein product [Arabis nemorensis]